MSMGRMSMEQSGTEQRKTEQREMNRIALMIADPHAAYCAYLRSAMIATRDIDVVGEVHDGASAVETVEKVLPDALVIDAVLPGLDGLGVISRIRSMALEKTPRVIVLTYPGQEDVKTQALRLGADVCVDKLCAAEHLAQCIRFCCARHPCCISQESLDGYAQEIIGMLARIRMGMHLDGYAYLCYGVPLVCWDAALVRALTTRVYPMIARHFQTDPRRVERSIRHAIETTFNTGDYRAIYELFGNTIDPQRGKPTNGEFIALLAETARLRVRRRLQDA